MWLKDMKHVQEGGKGEGCTCGFPIVARRLRKRGGAP